jgi:hypothetical protein
VSVPHGDLASDDRGDQVTGRDPPRTINRVEAAERGEEHGSSVYGEAHGLALRDREPIAMLQGVELGQQSDRDLQGALAGLDDPIVGKFATAEELDGKPPQAD